MGYLADYFSKSKLSNNTNLMSNLLVRLSYVVSMWRFRGWLLVVLGVRGVLGVLGKQRLSGLVHLHLKLRGVTGSRRLRGREMDIGFSPQDIVHARWGRCPLVHSSVCFV